MFEYCRCPLCQQQKEPGKMYDRRDDSGDPILGAYDLYVARHNHWTHDTLETIWEQFSYEVKLNPNNELKFHDLPFSEFLIGEIITYHFIPQ